MESPEFQKLTETKLQRIAWLSSRDSGKVFNNLIHLFNMESLKGCFQELDGRKALGADGISKDYFESSSWLLHFLLPERKYNGLKSVIEKLPAMSGALALILYSRKPWSILMLKLKNVLDAMK